MRPNADTVYARRCYVTRFLSLSAHVILADEGEGDVRHTLAHEYLRFQG